MGKTYRRDAKNAGWRRAKLEREGNKNNGTGRMFEFDNREDEAEQLRRNEKNGLYGGVEDIAGGTRR